MSTIRQKCIDLYRTHLEQIQMSGNRNKLNNGTWNISGQGTKKMFVIRVIRTRITNIMIQKVLLHRKIIHNVKITGRRQLPRHITFAVVFIGEMGFAYRAVCVFDSPCAWIVLKQGVVRMVEV